MVFLHTTLYVMIWHHTFFTFHLSSVLSQKLNGFFAHYTLCNEKAPHFSLCHLSSVLSQTLNGFFAHYTLCYDVAPTSFFPFHFGSVLSPIFIVKFELFSSQRSNFFLSLEFGKVWNMDIFLITKPWFQEKSHAWVRDFL